MRDVTFVFENGITYGIHQGKVIAASADADEVERQVKTADFGEYLEHGGGGGDPDVGYEGEYAPHGGGGACPGCGSPIEHGHNFCPHCGEPISHGADGPLGPHDQEMGNAFPHDEPSPGVELGSEGGPFLAKQVTTPNGLKGSVLGKVAGLWGDEVTVRLENGRIVKLPVGTELRTARTASAPVNPIARLEARLASTPDGTRESLVSRVSEITKIADAATTLIREGVSYADSVRLDQIAVTANNEGLELVSAIQYLDEAEKIEAPRSFSIGAAHEAAGISREDASWLDHTLDEMIKQAEATDFTKLMDEGPEAFIAELPDVALADTGVTRQMASSFIGEKTAGIDRKVADPYMDVFLARIEECRRSELSNRKQTTHKEAAAQEDEYKDLPDDCIFLS